MSERRDPIGDQYFKPLLIWDGVANVLFYVTAALSVATLLVSKAEMPVLYDVVQIAFVLCVIFGGVLGFILRLYLSPRATDKRRQDLLSNTFGVPLTQNPSEGYYNNDQKHPLRRLVASTMESSFFTEAVLRRSLVGERTRIAIYTGIWIVAAMVRTTDLGIIAVAAQVLFGEQTLSKWLRTEWLRLRSERVFEQSRLLVLERKTASSIVTQAQILDAYADYESSKAIAGIVLSSTTFAQMNDELSKEWDRIRGELSL